MPPHERAEAPGDPTPTLRRGRSGTRGAWRDSVSIAHAVAGHVVDPGLGEIVLDQVQGAAVVHWGMIDPAPGRAHEPIGPSFRTGKPRYKQAWRSPDRQPALRRRRRRRGGCSPPPASSASRRTPCAQGDDLAGARARRPPRTARHGRRRRLARRASPTSRSSATCPSSAFRSAPATTSPATSGLDRDDPVAALAAFAGPASAASTSAARATASS